MAKRTAAFLSELPPAPDYNPVAKAIESAGAGDAAAALRQFASMPASTGVLANPVRYQHTLMCGEDPVELNIRSFTIRGCLFEEDIVEGSADALRVIFVGLFGRFATGAEKKSFSLLCSRAFRRATLEILPLTAKFMRSFPHAAPNAAMQYVSCLRNAAKPARAVNGSRAPADLLRDLTAVHMENTAAGACASYMRALLRDRRNLGEDAMVRQTRHRVEAGRERDPFHVVFNLLLRRNATNTEAFILQRLGAIQIHHGSAGSNMIARYFASLHTRSVSDLFTASQMGLDCARHFGAITDLTEFVAQLERAPRSRRDELIRARAIKGALPGFGHPEIAAAGRANRIEIDPRPAIYLAPLLDAIDAGRLEVSRERMQRIGIVQRMYQIAFVEGIEKAGRTGRLRIAPNTDFGAWIVQEALGIDNEDRTLLSYVYRGFGWMMDVREQLQQPIIRPVIPPDPAIALPPPRGHTIPAIVEAVHERLRQPNKALH